MLRNYWSVTIWRKHLIIDKIKHTFYLYKIFYVLCKLPKVHILLVKRIGRKYRGEKIVSIHVHAVNTAHFYINTMLRKNIKDKDVIARKMFWKLENSLERKILHNSFPYWLETFKKKTRKWMNEYAQFKFKTRQTSSTSWRSWMNSLLYVSIFFLYLTTFPTLYVPYFDNSFLRL